MTAPTLKLGTLRTLDDLKTPRPWVLPAHHLVTHGVVTGMTGSGKTGLLVVLIEEALRAGIPVLMIDVKGDLANLRLAFPSFDPAHFVPWVDASAPGAEGRAPEALAAELSAARREGLAQWQLDETALQSFAATTEVRVLTPGGTAGEPVHLLSALERRSARWDTDPETARDALGAAVSLVLRLLGRDADPARSREHVLLSVLAEQLAREGDGAELGALVQALEQPPIAQIGALGVDAFLPRSERRALAAALNALLASPVFATWRQGASMDVGAWLARGTSGRTPGVIVSVAHLDDGERELALGVLLAEVLAWVRGLSGSSGLKALIVFDEVYGFLPPHPANPATKRPLVALMKQARGFGVGVVVATQNPMDLDYRALGNAGLWCVGRLLTDADRARVVEGMGMGSGSGSSAAVGAAGGGAGGGRRGRRTRESELGRVIKQLGKRWFVARDVMARAGEPVLVQPRWAMSWLKGPLTRSELKRVCQGRVTA